MADNIKLRKPNFTTLDGYFLTFDEDQDALLQKTDDGNTAFSYPLDTVLTQTILSTEYDGLYFWTLESKADGRIIRRWLIDNYVCKLQQTITLTNDGSHTYNANTFSVEHYHTTLTASVTSGSTEIYLNEYSNTPEIINGCVLYIGPNSNNDYELVTVSGTIFGGVSLTTPLVYGYDSNDAVGFNKYLWLLNNSNGVDTSTGALYKLDSHTGAYITKYAGGQYKDITACTFHKISAFSAYGSVDTLAYIKGTNTLFVNTSSNLAMLYDATESNDSFTAANGSVPDTDKWDVLLGTPTIQSNQLYTSTASGQESIISDYYLRGNFDVTVTGSLNSYNTTYSGANYFTHMFGLWFPNETNRYCYIARANNNETATQSGINNFNVTSYKATKNIDYSVPATYSGGGLVDNYMFRVSRAADNVSFYYKKGVEDWGFMGTVQMFDTECKLLLGLKNTLGSTVTAAFDDLVYNTGESVWYVTATNLPFYGSMVMENIQSDEITVIPVYDLAIDNNNVYRLQNIEDGGGSMSGYNYQLSPLSSFVTSISLSASPAIIAANNLSTSDITAYVKDQFLQPIAGRRVTFSENGDGAITAGTQINTDSDGMAQTVYRAGVVASEVTITAVVEQTN
ncbi:MAG TPA: invasin domain 3-containing protein [Patescibacteria group bacterium]|nr:invasin domain 3-containing protein [Patescibacteria group bacterium]